MAGRDDDQYLVETCRAGQSEAFGILVRRYRDRLHPTLLRLTGRAEDAEDLLQETFLRAFAKLNRFHGDSSFYTWIYRIAVNLALSARRGRPITLPLSRGAGGEPLDPADDHGRTDPGLRLERAERDDRIQNALNALAPDHRAVVILKDFDGLRYEEIAEIVGIPIGTVRSRLHRARSELRERLRTLFGEESSSSAANHRN